MTDDALEARLRAEAAAVAAPPAGLAERCLERVRRDRARRRRLRLALWVLPFAAAAGLAIALLRPQAHDHGRTPTPEPIVLPVAGAPEPEDATAAAPDLPALVPVTAYHVEREAILRDLRGCRAFLAACVPRVALDGPRGE